MLLPQLDLPDHSLKNSLKMGKTLPANWYTDEGIFELEKERIFSQSWQYVGRADTLIKPGDFLTTKAGKVPIVLLRDEQNELRAYVNVCKHRGAEVLLEGSCGNRKTLQCHYHAWTWGLDGQLKSAPRSENQACFQKAEYPLTSVPIKTFGPFIFVNPSSHLQNWEEFLGELPSIVKQSGFDLNRLRYRGQRVYEMKANWKVVVENFLECYHCPISHKGFSSLIDLNTYTVTPHRWFSVQRGALKESSKLSEKEKQFDVEEGAREGLYNFLWPNFMVNTYPGPANASTNFILPLGPHHTLAIYEFFMDETIPEREQQKLIDFIDEVQKEDVIICESVQRGLRSGHYQQGQLILAKENGIQHFQRLVYEALENFPDSH